MVSGTLRMPVGQGTMGGAPMVGSWTAHLAISAANMAVGVTSSPCARTTSCTAARIATSCRLSGCVLPANLV